MKLVIFNGSPRGEKSNTKIYLEQFLKGFTQTPENKWEVYYLKNITEHAQYVGIFEQSEMVLLAFPLYTDAMPGIVKAFIEELKPKGAMQVLSPEPKQILFLVQSGFPEAVQLEAVEKYLFKLAKRLGYQCAGVIIKGGGEGIQEMPDKMTRKVFQSFYALGDIFGQRGVLDKQLLQKIRGIRRFSVLLFPLYYLLKWVGVLGAHWNGELKENNAFEKRFDRPYL